MHNLNSDKRLLFFLGPHFGVLFLTKLADEGARLNFKVVTYSQDSDAYYGYQSVVEYCNEHGLEYLDTSSGLEAVTTFCKHFDPSMIICGYYAKILPNSLLERVHGDAFNIHPGKLPLYRGPFPTAWAMIHGEKEIGITIHQMTAQVDRGPIAAQQTASILPEETGFELYRRSMELSASFLCSKMPDLLKKNVRLVDQDTIGEGNYYGRIEPRYPINWKEGAAMIQKKVRVHAMPYFPAYSFVKNKMIMVNRCQVVDYPSGAPREAGRILDITSNGTFYVSTGEGVLEITEFFVSPLDDQSKKTDFLKKGTFLA